MSENCSSGCSSCSSAGGCGGAQQEPQSLLTPPNEHSSVKRVIAVMSGKGGVGKSLVTSLLATAMARRGHRVGVLDADITGPSIPKVFGVKGEVEKANADSAGIRPLKSAGGIDIMSINLLLKDESDPVVWRGPIVAGVVQQFWQDVVWENEDYLFVDMPPGTGDVPLTVLQSLPIDGIIVVTSPQELVSMIVEKAVKMAGLMNAPILGIIENMAYFKCPNCSAEHKIFGDSHIEEIARDYYLPLLARLPIEPKLAALCDAGKIESFEGDWVDAAALLLEELPEHGAAEVDDFKES